MVKRQLFAATRTKPDQKRVEWRLRMGAERHFLGWRRPLLMQAAVWLRERFAGEQDWDMSGVTVVVPTARAGRRLMELLATQAGEQGLSPPAIVTPGALPERLYRCEDTADALMCVLARVKVLRELPAEAARRLTGEPPDQDDLRGWWSLATELMELAEELAADGVTASEVIEATADPSRWMLLREVEEACAECLASQGLVDCSAARRRALEEGPCEAPGPIVLVGVADLNRLTRRFLDKVREQVVALIAAPEMEAGAFCEFGGLIVEKWADRCVEVEDSQWIVADRPGDQAREAAEAIAAASREVELSPDQVTVGLGDDALGASVERVLRLSGVPARRGSGRVMAGTRPALLLSAFARYLRTLRFDDFAALARHPDLSLDAAGVEDWLTLLDRYATDHLQGRITGTWLGEEAPRLKAVHDAVHALLPMGWDRARPLPGWAEPIAELLGGVYGEVTLRRGDPEDAGLIGSLECMREALERLAGLDEAGVCTPRVPLHGALSLLLEQVGESIVPVQGDGPAVEVVGFLELPLDDADVLVVTGLNEGSIPSGVGADALLPGKLRAKLGVRDNRRRLARDLYALTGLLERDARVTLVSGRRSAEGDPLAPSRLLLRCEPRVMAARLRRFYEDEVGERRGAATLIAPGVEEGKPSRFHVPRPEPAARRIERLRVTAFRDYLACPYRFYLCHVLGLCGSDDEAVEMSGGVFGTLAHEALSAFARSDLAGETDAERIAVFLGAALDDTVRDRFGAEPGAAVVLQREQLRERLVGFAGWQAEQAALGWRIVPAHVERRCEAVIDVDGEPFTIRGDVDRIDWHDAHGWRVIDYKTQDKGESPEVMHRKGGEWINLQLPLYRELVRGLGCEGRVELGYVVLPRDVGKVGWVPAEWTDAQLDEALERAKAIVRAVRAEAFWPPGEPPTYADEYACVCFDRVLDRAAVLRDAVALAKGASS